MANEVKSLTRPMFTTVRNNCFYTGLAVSAVDIINAGRATNHLMGRGNQIIPSFIMDIPSGSFLPSPTTGSKAAEYEVRFRMAPSIQTIDRLWTFGAVTDSFATLTVSGWDSGGQGFSQESIVSQDNQPFLVRQSICCLDFDVSGTTEYTVKYIYSSSYGHGFRPTNIQCFELPRVSHNPITGALQSNPLADTGGVDESSLRPGYAIFSSVGGRAKSSVGGIARNISESFNRTRRAGLFAWAVPAYQDGSDYTDFCLSSSATSTDQKLVVPILPSPTYIGVTSSNVLFMWYAKNDIAGQTSTVTLENGLGDSVTYTMTDSWSTSFAWHSASLPFPQMNALHERGLATNSVSGSDVGFLPYLTMSLEVSDASQTIYMATFQGLEPDLRFTGSFD